MHESICKLHTSKLLAVDGLATCAVAPGEITALEHEVGDDTVEGRALVAVAMLASRELAEVGGSLGDYIVVELEGDAAGLGAVNGDIELGTQSGKVTVRAGSTMAICAHSQRRWT